MIRKLEKKLCTCEIFLSKYYMLYKIFTLTIHAYYRIVIHTSLPASIIHMYNTYSS